MKSISDNVLSLDGGELTLFGGRCKTTGKTVFPVPSGPDAAGYERIALKSEGTLWAYTVQRFPPKSPPFIGANTPETFIPFAVGYVELEGQVIVESHLKIDAFERLKVGQKMKLTTRQLAEGRDGDVIHTYAFEPAEG